MLNVVSLGEVGEAEETEEVEVDLTQSMSDEEIGPENVEQVITNKHIVKLISVHALFCLVKFHWFMASQIHRNKLKC